MIIQKNADDNKDSGIIIAHDLINNIYEIQRNENTKYI